MRSPRSWCLAVCVLLVVPSEGRAQEKHAYQSDFTAAEFADAAAAGLGPELGGRFDAADFTLRNGPAASPEETE